MSAYQSIVRATQDRLNQKVLSHPLIVRVLGDKISRALYCAYLRETYHLVKHTPRFLAATAASLGCEHRELRSYFLTQALDEDGHDQMCLKDLREMGCEADATIESSGGAGASYLVSQAFYNASIGNPFGNLGLASLTEGLGAGIAATVSEKLINTHGYSRKQTTFLRSHSSFDIGHLADVEKAVNKTVVTPEDQRAVVTGRLRAIDGYSMLFDDVLAADQNLENLQNAAYV